MISLTRTFALSLLFSAFMLLSSFQVAQANCLTKDCATSRSRTITDTTKSLSVTETDEFDFDFDDPFFFNNKIVINVYNLQDELIYSKSFTTDEAATDVELKAMLKKSEFLLSIDNQHYYYTKK